MSRVHLNYNELPSSSSCARIFDVVSPDFSLDGTDDEVIGRLQLDVEQSEFSFEPTACLPDSFCPPEYFEEAGGNPEFVRERCELEHKNCTAWSYQIYKRAKRLLSENASSPGC